MGHVCMVLPPPDLAPLKIPEAVRVPPPGLASSEWSLPAWGGQWNRLSQQAPTQFPLVASPLKEEAGKMVPSVLLAQPPLSRTHLAQLEANWAGGAKCLLSCH